MDVYEIGTGKLTFSLPLNLSASGHAWSPDGRYLTVTSQFNSAFKIFQTDTKSQENIWTLIDELKRDPKFWIRHPINLLQRKVQDHKEQRSKAQQGYTYSFERDSLDQTYPIELSGQIKKIEPKPKVELTEENLKTLDAIKKA